MAINSDNNLVINDNLVHKLFNPEVHQHGQNLEDLRCIWDKLEGYDICINTFVTNNSQDSRLRFLCLHLLELWFKKYYEVIPLESVPAVRGSLCLLLQHVCSQNPPEKVFVRNKLCQLLSLAFVIDYENRWTTFFDDILELLKFGAQAADLYLKILKAIDSEVVERDCLHTQSQIERANHLKDLMRERAVVKNTSAWYDILVKYEKDHPAIVCECHEVIGSYISWIDICLIANERFVGVLVRHMKDPLLREAAAECLLEVITKGMDPMRKTQLIESICVVLEQDGLLKLEEDDDSDFIVKLAKLVNGIGTQLILSHNKLSCMGDRADMDSVRQAIDNKSILLLQFLASDFDDVSGAVFDYAKQYIGFIQRQGKLCDENKARLENMLYILITKSKFDESYNFDQMGEDEVMFNDYRKTLKVVFDNLASFIPELALEVSKDYITTTLSRWQGTTWQENEAALNLLYHLGEAVPPQLGSFFTSPLENRNEMFKDMVRLLVTSGISNHTHNAVVLTFFECIVRYDKFFLLEPNHLPSVLSAFFDLRGLRNPSARIRSRCSNFFMRFTRSLKPQLLPFFTDIMSQLQPLLGVYTTRLASRHDYIITPEDQQCVYECCAQLIVAGKDKFSDPSSADLMRQLLSPVLQTAAQMAQKLSLSNNPQQQDEIGSIIFQCSALVARTTKGFTSQVTMKSVNCIEFFVQAATMLIEHMSISPYLEPINKGVRQLIHRLIVCLDAADILPLMPAASQGLLRTTSLHTLSEYIPIINQLMSKHQAKVLEFVKTVLEPLVHAIFRAGNDPALMEDEDLREKKQLQKSYYGFIGTIVSSKLVNALLDQNQSLQEEILMSVVQGAVDFPDVNTQKSCFIILKRLVEAWGQASNAPPIFIPFIYTQIVPACLMAPVKPSFDLRDYHTVQALGESAACIKEIHKRRGDEFTNFLRNEYLPKLELSPTIVNEYCHAVTCEPKFFRDYCKAFFLSIK